MTEEWYKLMSAKFPDWRFTSTKFSDVAFAQVYAATTLVWAPRDFFSAFVDPLEGRQAATFIG